MYYYSNIHSSRKGEMALLNGKPEELTRYSKLNYDAKLFIQKAHELWEYSDL